MILADKIGYHLACLCLLCNLVLPTVAHASGQVTDTTVCKIALSYVGTPYVAGTLEVPGQERLVIDTARVDCTTLVEYVLAEAMATREVPFAQQLCQLRYRDGVVKDYTSRLHYITEWLAQACERQKLCDVTAIHATDSIKVQLGFMSAHPDKYRQLREHESLRKSIREIEKRWSGAYVKMLKKRDLPPEGLPWINSGDVVVLLTSIKGLDAVHVGFAYHSGGMLRLLHASSLSGRVEISDTSLREMLLKRHEVTGIRVVRRCMEVVEMSHRGRNGE